MTCDIDRYHAIMMCPAGSRAFGLEGSQVAAKFSKEEGHLVTLEIWRIMNHDVSLCIIMYHDMLMIR